MPSIQIEQSPKDTALFLYNIYAMRGEYPITPRDVEKVLDHLLSHACEQREQSQFEGDIHTYSSNEYIKLACVVNALYQLGRTASRKWKATYHFEE